MLIEYLFEKLPDWEGSSGQAIGDLEVSRKDNELISGNHGCILIVYG